jgi:hypothetical protein
MTKAQCLQPTVASDRSLYRTGYEEREIPSIYAYPQGPRGEPTTAPLAGPTGLAFSRLPFRDVAEPARYGRIRRDAPAQRSPALDCIACSTTFLSPSCPGRIGLQSSQFLTKPFARTRTAVAGLHGVEPIVDLGQRGLVRNELVHLELATAPIILRIIATQHGNTDER